MAIQGMIGPSYSIQCSADMAHWKTIATMPNVNGIFQFNDTGAGPCRFYRIIMQP
jgi:hypothetical protein